MHGELINPARFIVDLMEARASVQSYRPATYREKIPLHEIHEYQFLNALIAKLTDKYGVRYEDIEDEIKMRNYENY